MALPIIHTPTYSEILPDSGKKVEFRPFLAGEYKSLLQINTFEDINGIVKTIRNVLIRCVKTPNFDFDALSFVDVEFLYFKVYMRSSESVIHTSMRCIAPVTVKDEDETEHTEECNTTFDMPIYIDDVLVTQTNINKIIDLGNNVGIKLKYPTWAKWFLNSDKEFNDEELILSCVESIYDADTVYIPFVDSTKEELLEFIGRLDKKSMETIFEFLEQMPTVTWRKEIACPSCGTKSTVEYKGLDDFLN